MAKENQHWTFPSVSRHLTTQPAITSSSHLISSHPVALPFIFGPFVPGFPAPAQGALSSNQHIYTLLKGSIPPPLPPLFCDVRDVAHAHVAALSAPKSAGSVEDKRFLVYGGVLTWKQAVEYLHEKRPELKA
ncbi:hypothetical protein H0H81_007759, partial [Sphagnurus paluster]